MRKRTSRNAARPLPKPRPVAGGAKRVVGKAAVPKSAHKKRLQPTPKLQPMPAKKVKAKPGRPVGKSTERSRGGRKPTRRRHI